ncbi:cytochrome P450 [Streptomyces sp. NPDC001978]|uniref:cytochrome P450 n=1 Tax=Streptomyces sp. NPDC001978 TaxID=3364627 RepID=UPI00367A7B6C
MSASTDERLAAFFRADQSLIADPFELYRELRASGPVYHWQDRILVTHYEPSRHVLNVPTTLQGLGARGPRYRKAIDVLSEEDGRRLSDLFDAFEKRISGVDGEQHKRLRRLSQRAFTPRFVNEMQSHVQSIVDEMLEPLRDQDEIEFIGQFMYHVPLIVLLEMYDLPREDRAQIRDWASSVGRLIGADLTDSATVREIHKGVFDLRKYLLDFFRQKRGSETTPLLRALLEAEGDDEDNYVQDDLIAVLTQMVVAGHETTTHLVTNSIATLLRDHRDQWEILRDQPERIPGAVEELLRFCGPAQYLDKLSGETVTEIAGVEIPEMSTVSVFIGAANRDEAVYDDPDSLDVTRAGKPHLGFGFGPHHCLGAALARMEAVAVLTTLTQRFPSIELARPEPVTYNANMLLRGVAALPVKLGPEHRN